MIRTQVVDLLIPECSPDILADELDRVQRIREQRAVVTQPTSVSVYTQFPHSERNNDDAPLSNVRPNMHSNTL